jgi:hypothetical protein
VYHIRHYNRGGGRMVAQMPGDPPAHRLPVGLRGAAQPGVDLDQLLRQALALARQHRAFLFRPGFAAA